jgi:hypothetical protein
VEKSSDLSMASQMFYKQAKKTNSCCTILWAGSPAGYIVNQTFAGGRLFFLSSYLYI